MRETVNSNMDEENSGGSSYFLFLNSSDFSRLKIIKLMKKDADSGSKRELQVTFDKAYEWVFSLQREYSTMILFETSSLEPFKESGSLKGVEMKMSER